MSFKGFIRRMFGAMAVLAVSVAAVSCVFDQYEQLTPIDGADTDKVRLTIHADAGGFQLPTTRAGAAADEYSMYAAGRMPWVIVIDGAGIVVEMVQTTMDAEKGLPVVELTKRDDPVMVGIVANMPGQVYARGGADSETEEVPGIYDFNEDFVANTIIGKDADLAAYWFFFPLLSSPYHTSLPYEGGYLPMFGFYDQPVTIGEDTSIGTSENKVSLYRAVAKVTVESTAAGFELTGATAVNVNRSTCIGAWTSDDAGGIGGMTSYSMEDDELTSVVGVTTSGSKTTTDPMYVYATYATHRSAVIFEGVYGGETYFYKMDFMDSDLQRIDVTKNRHYKFVINAISGPGYGSAEEALAGASFNSTGVVEGWVLVMDFLAHDVVDNGEYYLGLAWSEIEVWSDQAVEDELAIYVTTNATSDMGLTTNVVTASNGITLSGTTLSLATSEGDTGETEIILGITEEFEHGTVTIRLGNLSKCVSVTRKGSLPPTGMPIEFGPDFVSAKDMKANNCFLSLDGIAEHAGDGNGEEVVRLDGEGSIYLMPRSNINQDGKLRTGHVWFKRSNDKGQMFMYYEQRSVAIDDIVESRPVGFAPYVGAFWRNDQSGERLIRIPYVDGAEGNWTATVAAGEEWIRLDTQESADINLGWLPGGSDSAVADMNDAANDVVHTVGSGSTFIRGMLRESADDAIYFRIGLTGANPNSSPRYGLIVLSYNNGERYQRIYVRQGEDADYVFRPTDTYGGGSLRDKAQKISPYNLSLPKSYLDANSGVGAYKVLVDANDGMTVGETEAVFTEYPSQAGYFFTFNSTSHAYHPMRKEGYDTGTYTPTNWADRPMETCPEGYRRFSEGADTENLLSADSETMQSLFSNVPTAALTSTLQDNMLSGLYADGYFDRRSKARISNYFTSDPSVNPSYVVSDGTARAAFAGQLIFNPSTCASLFIPYAMEPVNDNYYNGYIALLWSSTYMSDSQAKAWSSTFIDRSVPDLAYLSQAEMMPEVLLAGKTIRCVKDNTPVVTPMYEQIGYVGAFWRWDQTGERIIRHPAYTDTGYNTIPSEIQGTWKAQVIEGQDWIRLSKDVSGDSGMYGSSPADMNTSDASYQVSSTRIMVNGTCDSSTPIYFRIGLTDQHPSGSAAGVDGTATPRYGVVRLTYAGGTKYSDIYVRQGEAAAYLYSPTDTYGNGTLRSKAVRVSPYNLSVPASYLNQNSGRGAYTVTLNANNGTAKAVVGDTDAVFTEYPSQAGYYVPFTYTSRAYHPDALDEITIEDIGDTPTTWAEIPMETCPSGYRRFNEGDGFQYSEFATGQSEVLQSLYGNNLWYGLYSDMEEGEKSYNSTIVGLYADGYFDRHAITAFTTDVSTTGYSVSDGTGRVAYGGMAIFNPSTKASVFFPFSGQYIGAYRYGKGNNYNSWTSSTLANSGGNFSVIRLTMARTIGGFDITKYSPMMGQFLPGDSVGPVRCVKE